MAKSLDPDLILQPLRVFPQHLGGANYSILRLDCLRLRPSHDASNSSLSALFSIPLQDFQVPSDFSASAALCLAHLTPLTAVNCKARLQRLGRIAAKAHLVTALLEDWNHTMPLTAKRLPFCDVP